MDGATCDEPTVYIVDNDPATLRSQRYLLESLRYRVETDESPAMFLERLRPESRGCVLLDLQMDEYNGLDVISVLNERGIRIPVILMTAYGTVATAVTAVRGGAIDVLEKPIPTERLVGVINQALQQDKKQHASDKELAEICARFRLLSEREREVLRLVVQGYSSKLIGAELEISPKTVEAHRGNIGRKTKTENLAELVRLSVLWEQWCDEHDDTPATDDE